VVENNTDGLKITSLLSEYREIRTESRTLLILEMICIFLSILVFVALFTITILSTQYILLFISPALSLLFIILATGIFIYAINLGIRASKIEGQVKRILGEVTIQWESTVGIFGEMTQQSNIFSARLAKQWLAISLIAMTVAGAPVVFTLGYYFNQFYKQYGNVSWWIIGIDIFAFAVTILFSGIRLLYRPAWRQ
jgi:hypothetical protein